ncbi:hypothetical protein MMC21_003249, partial [Puttea exsequens]|nr:hypothetical protein [Puttea exsequens]
SQSWHVSLAEFILKIAFAVGHFVIYRKTRADEHNHLADGLGGAITDGLENAF